MIQDMTKQHKSKLEKFKLDDRAAGRIRNKKKSHDFRNSGQTRRKKRSK